MGSSNFLCHSYYRLLDQVKTFCAILTTGSSTKAHVCRALLEAICFQVRELMDAMNSEGGVFLHTLKVDGGAAKNDLLMQMQVGGWVVHQ